MCPVNTSPYLDANTMGSVSKILHLTKQLQSLATLERRKLLTLHQPLAFLHVPSPGPMVPTVELNSIVARARYA